MARFSGDDAEILIEEVQKYECIFDYEDKNFIIRENAWKKIAISAGKDVDDCKKRWKSIKDTYLRNKKKRKLVTGSALLDKPVKWNKQERSSVNTHTLSENQFGTRPPPSGEEFATNGDDQSTLDDHDIENWEPPTRETPNIQISQQKPAVSENNTQSSSSRYSTPMVPKEKKPNFKISMLSTGALMKEPQNVWKC
ncbi:uncharacterized protein LOC115874086 [Sitophilus oryzae]|uniref:Uncharacterized protein LOC115874086 n=1 Tax=Sitophilus oryzae TaxID=7048 RepID=A0A6J2X1Z3_SITOR|nr:uncharacterized protein LOC115874086 [Sitophilus oryzae]